MAEACDALAATRGGRARDAVDEETDEGMLGGAMGPEVK